MVSLSLDMLYHATFSHFLAVFEKKKNSRCRCLADRRQLVGQQGSKVGRQGFFTATADHSPPAIGDHRTLKPLQPSVMQPENSSTPQLILPFKMFLLLPLLLRSSSLRFNLLRIQNLLYTLRFRCHFPAR